MVRHACKYIAGPVTEIPVLGCGTTSGVIYGKLLFATNLPVSSAVLSRHCHKQYWPICMKKRAFDTNIDSLSGVKSVNYSCEQGLTCPCRRRKPSQIS